MAFFDQVRYGARKFRFHWRERTHVRGPDLLNRLQSVRAASLKMVVPLEPGDYRIQTMTAVSPPWWNLGHTSWFFAKNLLEPAGLTEPSDLRFEYILNSYYNCHGDRVPQGDRGKLSRPTTEDILRYRQSVDQRMFKLLKEEPSALERWSEVLEAGLQHEQQHQELFYTEIKHIWGMNPKGWQPSYPVEPNPSVRAPDARWISFRGGVFKLGAEKDEWAWDNERGGQDVNVGSFQMQSRLVTCGEFLEFIEAGGYQNPNYWLDNGWACVQEKKWKAPLYWYSESGSREVYTLGGRREWCSDEPVSHVSFYEADAYARWKAARLPSEEEWEFVARQVSRTDQENTIETGFLHPLACSEESDLPQQLFGDVWEWTGSNYRPYPGFVPFQGALSEYNGKFMDGQYVLRGGSCLTPRAHIRSSYRNFWSPATRFQMTGIRLVRTEEV